MRWESYFWLIGHESNIYKSIQQISSSPSIFSWMRWSCSSVGELWKMNTHSTLVHIAATQTCCCLLTWSFLFFNMMPTTACEKRLVTDLTNQISLGCSSFNFEYTFKLNMPTPTTINLTIHAINVLPCI